MPIRTGAPTATILSGQSLSSAIKLNGGFVEGIYMPASWTAATLSFAVSEDDSTYVPLTDALGVEMALTVAGATAIMLPLSSLRGWNYLKLRSGTSAAAVNQGADRAFTLITRAYA